MGKREWKSIKESQWLRERQHSKRFLKGGAGYLDIFNCLELAISLRSWGVSLASFVFYTPPVTRFFLQNEDILEANVVKITRHIDIHCWLNTPCDTKEYGLPILLFIYYYFCVLYFIYFWLNSSCDNKEHILMLLLDNVTKIRI